MKKLLSIFLVLNITLLVSCNTTNSDNQVIPNNETTTTYYKDKLKELDKYVFEVEEYTTLDYDVADEFYAKTNDNWGGGCTAVSKMVDGHRIVGRNMDQSISYKCVYIVRTNAGKYKTFGTVYTHRDYSPNYEDVIKNGISEEFYKALPFMCDDVVNDAGLHIEINMRHGEYWPNGEDKYACSGTNPDSTNRVYMFELPRYIGENCSSVEEAKEYVKTLDVYSQDHYWNYCFIISDSKGNSSLLEFSKNNIYWLDEDKIDSYDWLKEYNMSAIAQTNFYLNKDSWETQDIKNGIGRFIALQDGINNISSKSDVYDLMKKVQYSNYYLDYDECKNNYFDPRSDIIGEVGHLTYNQVIDPNYESTLRGIFNEYNSYIRSLTRQEKQDLNAYWESTFTEVVDVTSKEMFVRFFENDDITYLISFDGLEKINSISDWK